MKINKNTPYFSVAKWMLLLGFWGLTAGASWAQYVPDFRMFHANRFALNAAYAGQAEGPVLNLSGSYLTNSTDVAKGSGAYYHLTNFHMPLGKRVAIGTRVWQLQQGPFRRLVADQTFRYGLPLGDRQALSFGMAVGVWNERLSEAVTGGNGWVQENDPLLNKGAINFTHPKFEAALAYQFKDLEISVAAPLILTEDGMEHSLTAFVGYTLPFKLPVSLTPSILMVQTNPSEYDLLYGMQAHFSPKAWAQVSFTQTKSLYVATGFEMGKLDFGYSFGFPTSHFGPMIGQNHQISVGLRLGKKAPTDGVASKEE